MILYAGKGYLTLKFKHASLVIEDDGAHMEKTGDQPYIDVYMNDTKQDTSNVLDTCYQCDFNYVYESDLIDKYTKISFSVWDQDDNHWIGDNDDEIIAADDTKRTVAQYLQDGLVFLKNHQHPDNKLYNYMETAAFWTDQYQENEIDDAYLRQ